MNLWGDVRLGARMLLKNRAFTAAAVLVLALGIAATNTVYTLAHGVLLADLPFDEPDRIVMVATQDTGSTRNRNTRVSYLDLQDWRGAVRTFDGLGASREMTMNVADDRHAAERFPGAYISWDAFDLLGQQPRRGRQFSADDDRPGAAPVVMLGHAVWTTRYQGSPDVIGMVIRVNGTPATVIGVMPEGFGFPQVSQIWQPLTLLPGTALGERETRSLDGFGRLAAGVTIEQAMMDLGGVTQALALQHPDTNRNIVPRIAPYRERSIGSQVVTVFLALLGAVAFVLLIACANVANLLLARAARRTREVSVRMSLGASRWHVVRQLLVESVLLALLAGALGLALSGVGVQLFWVAVADSGPPYWLRFTMNGQVFLVFAAVCLGTAVMFGLVPALHTSRTSLVEVLNDAGRGSSAGIQSRRWTSGLVAVQLALTMVLLTGAGLMMRSFLAHYQLDTGVETGGMLTARLELSERNYPTAERRSAFYRQLDERLASLPGIRSAFASNQPRRGAMPGELIIEGREVVGDEGRPAVSNLVIGPRYFETLDGRMLRGRTLTDADNRPRAGVAVVNERLALMHFPGEDPIGRRIRVQTGPIPPEEWLTIVGVSGNVRQERMEDRSFDPIVYVPYGAMPVPYTNILARSDRALDVAALATTLRGQVQAVDADLALFDVMMLDESMAIEIWPQRIFGSMFAIFAAVALVIAVVGMHAVTAYSVAQRTREIGVRIALGAQAHQIWLLVTRRTSVPLAIGLLAGLAGSFGAGQVLRGLATQVSHTDPVTLVAVSTLLVLAALGATLVPARRAMRLDPVAALRAE